MANSLIAVSALTAPTSDVMLQTGAVATGDRISDKPLNRTYQATVTAAAGVAVSATAIIEASNDLIGWVPLGTITLTGTALASDGLVSQTMWRHVRARCTAISANSVLKVTMGSGSNG